MAKATTIKEALARWEEKSGQKASEAKEVKLYGQVPPVEKMDGALSALVNCEKLSLSTNCIDRIANLNNLSICKAALYAASSIETKSAALKYDQNHFCLEKKRDELRKIKRSRSAIRVQVQEKLRILSLGRNNIKNLNGLEAVADTLEELWISYNLIEKLRGIRVMKKLKILYMSNNLVKDWAEFVRLAELPLLEELVFVGNPLQEKFAADQNSWIEEATKRVPNLKKLDGTLVVKEEEEEGGEGGEGAEGAN